MDEHIEAVQEMKDYIESHLDTDITMADLAYVSRYSQCHSYRLFMNLRHNLDLELSFFENKTN